MNAAAWFGVFAEVPDSGRAPSDEARARQVPMSTDIRLLVTGSRDWPSDQRQLVTNRIGILYGMWICPGERLVVVHGACPKGVDRFASEYARRFAEPDVKITEERHPADWGKYDKRAGFVRNTEMCESKPDFALVFGVLCDLRKCGRAKLGDEPHLTHGTGHCLREIVRNKIEYELMVLNMAGKVYTGGISDIS